MHSQHCQFARHTRGDEFAEEEEEGDPLLVQPADDSSRATDRESRLSAGRSRSEPGLGGGRRLRCVHEGHPLRPRVVALWGQPLMLYGYLLYLHALLDGVGAGGGAERAGGAGGRFRRDGVLVDGVAGAVAEPRLFPQLLGSVVLELLGLRELLLLLLERRAPRQGRVRRRGLLSGSRVLRGLDGRPSGQRQRLLTVGPAIHGGAFFIAISLVVDAGEDQHVQHQEDAADAHGDGQGGGRAVVVARRQPLQQLGVVFGVVQDRRDVLGEALVARRRAAGGGRGGARPGRACQRQRRVPFVSHRA